MTAVIIGIAVSILAVIGGMLSAFFAGKRRAESERSLADAVRAREDDRAVVSTVSEVQDEIKKITGGSSPTVDTIDFVRDAISRANKD